MTDFSPIARHLPSHMVTDEAEYDRIVKAAMKARIELTVDHLGDRWLCYFPSVEVKDMLVPPPFERTKPFLRQYADDGQGGEFTWWQVLEDNTPGDPATPEQIAQVQARFEADTTMWNNFLLALEQHGKATVYAEKETP